MGILYAVTIGKLVDICQARLIVGMENGLK